MKQLFPLLVIASLLACNTAEPPAESFNPQIDSATRAFVVELRDVHNLDVKYPANNMANCFKVNKHMFDNVVIPLMDAWGLVYIADQDNKTEKVVIYGLDKKYKSR
jgi:hypothetical protein